MMAMWTKIKNKHTTKLGIAKQKQMNRKKKFSSLSGGFYPFWG
jgi:hypothetical protein